MYIIGLTGGIACGKSTVTKIIKNSFGASTLDIDRITKRLLQPRSELFDIYVRHFGKIIVTEEGNLNRKLIGEIIFNNPDERKWINSISHPVLLNHARDFLIECSSKGVPLVVLEVPLLFEAGWENLFDEIWAIYTESSIQILRLMNRDQLTREQAIARIKSQMSVEEICKRSDVQIKNVGDHEEIKAQISAAFRGRKF